MLSDYHSHIRDGAYIAIQLPSDMLKLVEMKKNTTISLGKFGVFKANLLIDKPYYLTWEIIEGNNLRVVPASELHAETLMEEAVKDDVEPDLMPQQDKNNRLTIDETSRQTLSFEEIEELKKSGTGKETIAKIMASHSALDEKTVYSLAKYALRKHKKFVKRFTALPMDVHILAKYMGDKDPTKIMDLREETLALATSWANVHHAATLTYSHTVPALGGGRWLVVDDTAGLVTAAMAEKMGILYPYTNTGTDMETTRHRDLGLANPRDMAQMAATNTITVVHSSPTQPPLSLLRYFGYLAEDPDPAHPLFAHLYALTWLQLLDPGSDSVYTAPCPDEGITPARLAAMKTSRRSAHFRKLRRWHRVKRATDVTRAGGFDGLIVCSWMEHAGVLNALVPLVRGGGQVVVLGASVEGMSALVDMYSREKKTAFLNKWDDRRKAQKTRTGDDIDKIHEPDEADWMDQDLNDDYDGEEEGFAVNPSLLLNPSLQTTRAIDWQVLPDRTHPLMTMGGGPEGYIFTATRVIPQVGVSAKGKFGKKRKVLETSSGADQRITKRAKSDQTETPESL